MSWTMLEKVMTENELLKGSLAHILALVQDAQEAYEQLQDTKVESLLESIAKEAERALGD